jgi:3-oxoacyl-[acyl-carrier-protein] synthase-3
LQLKSARRRKISFKGIPVGITGIGSYVPGRVLTNQELEQSVDTSDEWIRTRTGIVERRLTEDGVTTSDLAYEASTRALLDAGMKPEDIDLIIVATASPDMIFPSTACILQKKLGVFGIPAFDVAAACAGFVFGLSVAEQYVASGTYNRVLFVGSDALTHFVNWKDRNTCVLFGDGAGAVILERTEPGYGILSCSLACDGSGADLLEIPAGGANLPGTENSVKNGLHYIRMNGNEVFKFAVRAIPEISKAALDQARLGVDDVDYFIPHQANSRIINTAAAKLGIKPEKVVCNIDRYGNTSTASIPLALDEVWRRGELDKGKIVLLVGFGAGLTWGANVIRWSRRA